MLIYSKESWVVTGEMLKVFKVFHNWSARRITGITSICGAGRERE